LTTAAVFSKDALTIFIEDAQDGEEKTFLNNITIFGQAIAGTNMNDLKKSG
jgi:hypothetical protein